jgi:hypothetical protein
MLNRWAIVISFAICVAFFALVMPGQPNKAADPNQSPANPKQPVIVKAAPEKQTESAADKGAADPNSPKWYTALKRPDWWLVVVGFGTLVIVGIQTRMLRKSVAAAQSAADAATASASAAIEQANAILDAERAWIVESIQFAEDIPYRKVGGGVITARVTIKNIGKQPAFLRLGQLRFHSVEGALPQKPQYRRPQCFPDGFMIAPGDELYLRAALDEGVFDDDDVKRIRGERSAKPLKLYIYGKVVYASMGKIGINQFCYRWNNQMGFSWADTKPCFEKDGPEGYNEHT